MKIQDLAFFLCLVFLILLKNRRIAILAGLLILIIAIPFFYFHIFFTAERLTWYSAAFFSLGIIFRLKETTNENSD